jgi:multiple sugar transport system ATP-binding protein
MRGGLLQQFGTPAEIYEHPANVFVADFIGTPSMTLVDATLFWTDARPQVRIGSTLLPLLPQLIARGAADGLHIKLGVRPEDVILDNKGIAARVKVIEPTGHESIVLFEVDGWTVTARVPAQVHLDVGQLVHISLRAEKLHLFDRTSGQRLANCPSAPRN